MIKTLMRISLPFFCVFVLSYVVCLSFVMITFFARAYMVAGLEAPLEDKESSIRLVEGFNGSCCKLL